MAGIITAVKIPELKVNIEAKAGFIVFSFNGLFSCMLLVLAGVPLYAGISNMFMKECIKSMEGITCNTLGFVAVVQYIVTL